MLGRFLECVLFLGTWAASRNGFLEDTLRYISDMVPGGDVRGARLWVLCRRNNLEFTSWACRHAFTYFVGFLGDVYSYV